MRITQITPGAGDNFYCENCLRDNAVVRELRRAGHDALMVPLYLPPLSDGPAAVTDVPIFFGGINVYLQQKSGLFRKTPRWIDRLFDARGLLRWAGKKAGMTKAKVLGETMLSMLRGEHGRQVKELNRLTAWMARQDRPDIVCLSNAMLVGLTRRIKETLSVPVVCLLQDEVGFVDALPDEYRTRAWDLLVERADDVDAFIAVSRFYAEAMARRLRLDADRVHVVYNGIHPNGYEPAAAGADGPAIGFLSQMCRGKGLDTLVEAFIELKTGRSAVPDLKLRLAGGKTDADKAFLQDIRARLADAGVAEDVEFLDAFDRSAKQAFLPTLSVLSVPTREGEAFGLFVLEALACGVPVVLPDHGAFGELIEATGGGLLCRPNDPADLARAIRELLTDVDRAREMGRRGREVVLRDFHIRRTAQELIAVYQKVLDGVK